jgi:hypothetical protein
LFRSYDVRSTARVLIEFGGYFNVQSVAVV